MFPVTAELLGFSWIILIHMLVNHLLKLKEEIYHVHQQLPLKGIVKGPYWPVDVQLKQKYSREILLPIQANSLHYSDSVVAKIGMKPKATSRFSAKQNGIWTRVSQIPAQHSDHLYHTGFDYK